MHDEMKRHAVRVLREAGHTQREVSEHVGVSLRTIRRIEREETMDPEESGKAGGRGVGRPSKVAPFEEYIGELLREEPELRTLEILRRCRERGYAGGKSALYAAVKRLRPGKRRLAMRFEAVPGEFTQHDFGQVLIRFMDGSRRRVHFFASRLKWSRWVAVSLVPNQKVEALVRTLLDHFESMGGVPLCAVFDRPKTVALSWGKDGQVREWNATFAYAALEIGFTAEVCWPHRPNQKGAVENLVGWVKNSFFKQRRFHDLEDVRAQLGDWRIEVNERRPSRATGIIPEERRREEAKRLRPLRVAADDFALRFPCTVGPTGYVTHDTHQYSMPPGAAGLPGTIFLYRDRVRIVAGRYEAHHRRLFEPRQVSTLPDHRSAQLAAISGRRGKRYLKRQHLFETGDAAVEFITELVHRNPTRWVYAVERLHALLERHGAAALDRAFRDAVHARRFNAGHIEALLGARRREGVVR